jgi:hypothetical protein
VERGLVGAVAGRYDRSVRKSLRHQLSMTRPEAFRLVDDVPGMSITDRTYTTMAMHEATRHCPKLKGDLVGSVVLLRLLVSM